MQNIFLTVLDMSITGGIVILAVILARLLLKKAPKKYSYALWALVLLRLLCPISIESVLSLIPEKTQSIPQSVALEAEISENITPVETFDAAQRAIGDTLNGGIDFIDIRVDAPESTEIETVSASHSQVWLLVMGWLWPVGMGVMLLWSVVGYLRLRLRLRTAVTAQDNIYLADGISSPFVMGLFRPKIYLPSGIGEGEREYIIAHERLHIRRRDHWVKVLAFAALTVHWFNPLVWLAFVLSARDMEMSCDEAVIRSLGEDVRADYSASLLSLATGRRIIAGVPLAFGEGDPKGRIKNLAAWKKPAVWVSTIAAAVVIVAAVCLLTDPESHGTKVEKLREAIITEDGYTILDQSMRDVELSVPKSALTDSAYTLEGQEFGEKEVPVYDDGVTCIWLESVQQANETAELLYFNFDCSYGLPKDNGAFLCTNKYMGGGVYGGTSVAFFGSNVLAADNGEYAEAVSIRGQGPGEQFMFVVSAEAVRSAEGNMKMVARLNELTYAKGEDLPVSEDTPGPAEAWLGLEETLKNLSAGDFTNPEMFQSISPEALAAALNAVAEHRLSSISAEAAGYLGTLPEWSLDAYFEGGGTEGLNVSMRHLEIDCGLTENIVKITLREGDSQETAYYKDEALYTLLRHMRDYEELIEPEALGMAAGVTGAYLMGVLEEYAGNPGRFENYELTYLEHLGGYDCGDGSRVEICRFRYALIPEDIANVGLSGSMMVDSRLRVQGFGDEYLALKRTRGITTDYAVLGIELFYDSGEVSREQMDMIESALRPAPQLVGTIGEESLCRRALEAMLSKDALHYTVELGFANDGEAVVSDKINVWINQNDWLSIRETGTSKMTDLVKDMNAYNRLELYAAGFDTGWASAGGSYNMADLDSWLFGERDYKMEHLRTEVTADYTRMVFNVEENLLGVGEGSVELGIEMRYMGNIEAYYFDKSGQLYAVEIVASIKNDFDEPVDWAVVYHFSYTSEEECTRRIDEAYAEAAAALGLN